MLPENCGDGADVRCAGRLFQRLAAETGKVCLTIYTVFHKIRTHLYFCLVLFLNFLIYMYFLEILFPNISLNGCFLESIVWYVLQFVYHLIANFF